MSLGYFPGKTTTSISASSRHYRMAWLQQDGTSDTKFGKMGVDHEHRLARSFKPYHKCVFTSEHAGKSDDLQEFPWDSRVSHLKVKSERIRVCAAEEALAPL